MKTIFHCLLTSCLIAGLCAGQSIAFERNMGLASASVAYTGAINYGYTGWSISTGDVDGDGIKDFLIGGNKVYVILGKNIGKAVGSNIEDFASASFISEEAGDNFGNTVSMAGDVNNDGFDDILIGAQRHDGTRGKTYLVLGKASGWAMNTPIATAAHASFVGEYANDWSGHAVAFAGDINHDGFDDILIGAYMADAGGLVNAGRTYLFLGKAEGWHADTSLADADVIFNGEASSHGSGRTVAAAGDVNADGYADFLIGAPNGGSGKGATYLILGKASGWSGQKSLSAADASFYGEAYGNDAGCAVASAGDVNGDGFDDILIGADETNSNGSRAGKAYLILGKGTGWAMNTGLSSADASFLAENAGDHLGSAVASAGDLNNDGYDDFLIGATWTNEFTGKAYLVYGKGAGWGTNVNISTADASFLGESTYDYAGFSMAPAGDINKDGNDDLLISAAYFGPAYTGKTYFFYSDAAVYGDLDADRDVDGRDLAIFRNDLGQLNLEKFARQFGYRNG